jgi:ankyrin repeat protein
MGLDLLRMCGISTEDMTATETADAVGLIDQGADVHAKSYRGWTPLHRACVNGHAEVVKALLEKGADVHAKANDGKTPLHRACRYGHYDIAAMLRDRGAVDTD